jgi:PAS domain S-box-containing protein
MLNRGANILYRHDRKFALRFGALVLILMLTAAGAASYLFLQLEKEQEDRLSGVIGVILGESISRVNFSSKYQARLFVEEIKSRVPELAFISVEAKDGLVLAHSDPTKNDGSMSDPADVDLRTLSLKTGSLVEGEQIRDGKTIKEVVLPFRGGLDAEVIGVVRTGINFDEVRKEQRGNLFKLLSLVAALTAAAIWGVLILSHHFGSEVRALATYLQGILNHAPVAIGISDRNGRILSFSVGFELLFGRPTVKQTQSQLFSERLSASNVKCLAETDRKVFESGAPCEQELQVHIQGRLCTWEISKFPIARDNGGKTTLICAFIHDITERKQAEALLFKREQEFRSLAENSPDNILRHDQQCRIIYSNPMTQKTMHMDSEMLLGKIPTELDFHTSELMAEYEAHIRQVLEYGKSDDLEVTIPLPGSGYRSDLIRFAAERDAEGTIVSALSIGRDITELKQAQQERVAHLRHVESMDRVNRAIQGTNNLEQMLNDVLAVVLSDFKCDRVFLTYPCDPEAASYRVPIEQTTPEYPGAQAMGIEVPMDPEVSRQLRVLLDAEGPVQYGPDAEYPVPVEASKQFKHKVMMCMVLQPTEGVPWQFGIHQCTHARIWTDEEVLLFQEIGRRLADALNSLLSYRNLQESQTKLAEAQRIAHVGNWELDYSNNGLTWSDEIFRILELDPASSDATSQALQDVIHPDDRHRVNHTQADSLKNKTPCEIEHRLLLPDGRVKYVNAKCETYYGKDGAPIRSIGTMHDITERKLTEEALQLNAERMKTLLQLNQMTGETEAEIMKYAFEAAVRQTRSKLGYLGLMNEDESAMEVQVWSREVMPECAVTAAPLHFPVNGAGLWAEAVRQRRPIITNDYNAANPWKKGTPEGHVRLTRHMNVPLIVNGRIVLLAGVGNKRADYNDTDVQQLTLLMEGMWRLIERNRIAEEIRQLNAQLEQRVKDRTEQLEAANKELEAFAYSVSHDLRAPLRHIDGYVELLVSRCSDGLNEQGLHYAKRVADSARRMGGLIDDLLKFSRTGRAEIKHKTVDMNRMVKDVMAPITESCGDRTIEWIIGDLPSVEGDAPLLRQVWANLLGNAVKYTRPRESARIEVHAREENGEAVFTVADNGVGFDMRYADKLFGVFQRLHSPGNFEGTGIGLATVHRIITRHGGRVWAEAEVDLGARFYFSLPLNKKSIPEGGEK